MADRDAKQSVVLACDTIVYCALFCLQCFQIICIRCYALLILVYMAEEIIICIQHYDDSLSMQYVFTISLPLIQSARSPSGLHYFASCSSSIPHFQCDLPHAELIFVCIIYTCFAPLSGCTVPQDYNLFISYTIYLSHFLGARSLIK